MLGVGAKRTGSSSADGRLNARSLTASSVRKYTSLQKKAPASRLQSSRACVPGGRAEGLERGGVERGSTSRSRGALVASRHGAASRIGRIRVPLLLHGMFADQPRWRRVDAAMFDAAISNLSPLATLSKPRWTMAAHSRPCPSATAARSAPWPNRERDSGDMERWREDLGCGVCEQVGERRVGGERRERGKFERQMERGKFEWQMGRGKFERQV